MGVFVKTPRPIGGEKMAGKNPQTEEAWEASEQFYHRVFTALDKKIYVHDGQPGTGKTYSLAKYLAENPGKRIVFSSANHDHLKKFKKDLIERGIQVDNILHMEGFTRLCRRYPDEGYDKKTWSKDEKYVYYLYKNCKRDIAKNLCARCNRRKTCRYTNQKKKKKNHDIILQPLEYLNTGNYTDRDAVFVDESVNKMKMLKWGFNQEKIDRLNALLGTTKNKIQEEFLLKVHKAILKKTSIIFTKEADVLLNFNDNTYTRYDEGYSFTKKIDLTDPTGEDFFRQKGNIVTRPAGIAPSHLMFDDEFEEVNTYLAKWDIMQNLYKSLMDAAYKGINDAAKTKDLKRIQELFKNLVDLDECFEILMVIKKTMMGETGFIISEKISLLEEKDIDAAKCEVISEKSDERYERGFYEEKPYLKDKETGRYVVSSIGKEFTQDNIIGKKDAWFTIGHPYLFKIFDISLETHVVMLDATFNENLYERLCYQWGFLWLKMQSIRGSVHNLAQRSNERHPWLRTVKKPPLHVENKRSNLYYFKGNHSYSSFQKQHRELVYFLIDRVMHDNPRKSVGVVIKMGKEEKEVKKIKELFPKIKKENILHYGNQRGSSLDCDILFVVITPYLKPISYLYLFMLMFGALPKKIEVAEADGKFIGYTGELGMIFKLYVIDELYQALHRTRMLNNDREVYAICLLPEEIKKEVKCQEGELKDMSWYPFLLLLDIIKMYGEKHTKNLYRIDKKTLHIKMRNDCVKRVGGLSVLIDEAENKYGFVRTTKEKTKTKPKTIIRMTPKGKKFYDRVITFLSNKG